MEHEDQEDQWYDLSKGISFDKSDDTDPKSVVDDLMRVISTSTNVAEDMMAFLVIMSDVCVFQNNSLSPLLKDYEEHTYPSGSFILDEKKIKKALKALEESEPVREIPDGFYTSLPTGPPDPREGSFVDIVDEKLGDAIHISGMKGDEGGSTKRDEGSEKDIVIALLMKISHGMLSDAQEINKDLDKAIESLECFGDLDDISDLDMEDI